LGTPVLDVPAQALPEDLSGSQAPALVCLFTRVGRNRPDLIGALVDGRRLETLRGPQDPWNGNRLFVLAMIISPDCRSEWCIEEITEHGKSSCLRLPYVSRTRGSRCVRIIHDKRPSCAKAFTNECYFPICILLNVAADVRVRTGKVARKIRGFARPLQADENYGFRHGFNFGGRAPCRTAPNTGMYDN